MATIKFNNFTAFYKVKKEIYIAVDNITLEIPDGKITVVIGESGCGKTTLLKSILGSIDLTEGEVTIDGEKVDGISSNRGIAYVAQEYSLYPQMTAYENISYPLKMIKTPYDEIKKRVEEVARLLDIELLLTRKPAYLSGGQQQRVAIARAIVRNPDIVLFDEPFSNVEPKLRESLRALVKAIHKNTGATFVFVTHDLHEAYELADNVVYMKEGCVEMQGLPKDVIKNIPEFTEGL